MSERLSVVLGHYRYARRMPARTLYRSWTPAPRHRAYDAIGNAPLRHRNGWDCVFQDRRISLTGGPKKAALWRSREPVLSRIRPKATSGWPDDCFGTRATMSASGP